MATDFRSAATDSLGFVRFFGGTARGVCFEFGTMTNFERVTAAMRAGEAFVSETGEFFNGDAETAQLMDDLVVAGRVTFGEMAFTVEVGTGDMFNLTVEQ